MPIVVKCGSCQAFLRVADASEGKRVRCPRCKAVMSISGDGSQPQEGMGEGEKGRRGEHSSSDFSPSPLRPLSPSRSLPLAGSPPPPPPAKADLMTTILAGFDGEFSPAVRRLGYRLGLIFVSMAMVVLPLLYLSLIAGLIYLLYWHATANFGPLMSMHSTRAVVFLYAGPLIAGAILVFFMIKPLLARSAKTGRGRVLDEGAEPVLFAFVSRIAQIVRAPEPQRIEVDCDVNASAGFGSGWKGLFGRDLVLTIGLPLVGGLTTRQLAGVLAHELGHFSQGAGMRLSYVIRSINHWFVRVVFERDQWDEGLVRLAEEADRLAIIFYVASLGVFISRAILWVFMAAGHVLSCFLLRHMEYDADRYEARLVGSTAFEETSRRLAALDLASNAAQALAVQSWSKERLPDDLPGLVLMHTQQIPPKLSRLIEKRLKKEKTGLFDTHPCFKDRVANAHREDAPGIFHLDEPATILFDDYDDLSRRTTKHFYRQLLGKHLKRATFFTVEEAKVSVEKPGGKGE